MGNYKLFVILILSISGYAQTDCSSFTNGTYKIETPFGDILVERLENFQLESSKDFGSVYLEKIESVSECEYYVRRYKILTLGDLPMPNMNEVMKTEIYKVEGNAYFYESQMVGAEIKMKGILLKISDEVSENFKEIIKKNE